MDLWGWIFERRRALQAAGDEERVRMTHRHAEAFNLQETDPDAAYAILTEARHQAERLNEPWFVYFYDVWRVQALVAWKEDFRNVLDLAVRCTLDARKPELEQHPWVLAAYNHLVRVYLGIDPIGYADAIREALAYLDAVIEPGPNSHRYVLLSRKHLFAVERNSLEEARQFELEVLALADADPDPHTARWHSLPALCNLAWLAWRVGDWEAMESYAKAAAELAPRVRQGDADRAEATLWQAVAARRTGAEAQGRHYHLAAAAFRRRLQAAPHSNYYDALACYHELGDNLATAIEVRDRELAGILGKGRLVYECKVQIKRCRLLARAGQLQDADLSNARAAAAKLRQPASYLAEIEALAD